MNGTAGTSDRLLVVSAEAATVAAWARAMPGVALPPGLVDEPPSAGAPSGAAGSGAAGSGAAGSGAAGSGAAGSGAVGAPCTVPPPPVAAVLAAFADPPWAVVLRLHLPAGPGLLACAVPWAGTTGCVARRGETVEIVLAPGSPLVEVVRHVPPAVPDPAAGALLRLEVHEADAAAPSWLAVLHAEAPGWRREPPPGRDSAGTGTQSTRGARSARTGPAGGPATDLRTALTELVHDAITALPRLAAS